MKTRKFTALALAFVLALAMSVTALAADGDLIYEFNQDAIDAFVGGSDNYDGIFMQAGSPTWSAENGGLKASGRSANWNALDFHIQELVEAGKDYTIVAEVGAAGGSVTVVVNQTDSPYAELSDNIPLDGNEKTTFTLKLKGVDFVDTGMRGVRFQTGADDTSDYIIYSAKLYEGNPPAASSGGATGGGGEATQTSDAGVMFACLALAFAGGAFVVLRKRATR